MFNSQICSSGFGLSIPTNEDSFKNSFPGGGGDISKGREISGSDFFPNQNQSHGLARHRKAPTSFLAALLDSNTDGNGSSGDESEAFFSALIDGPRDLDQKNGENHHHHHHQVLYTLMQEIGAETETRRESFTNGHTGGYVGSYSPGMENQVHVSLGNNGNTSNLGRQSSSPAGFLNGFSVMGGKENYILQNHAEASGSSAAGFSNRHLNFSAGPSSGPRFMLAIPENPNESIATCRPENGQSRDSDSSRNELPSKRNRDGELRCSPISVCRKIRMEKVEKSQTGLISRMSLPKTISETADENYLHFREETSDVPFQIRARRGCATHPRSIAERIRRNRISDNMKKLQDVFPNMDKQINTADMLDSVVEYIKDLQKQVQILTDKKAKCVCEENLPDKPKHVNEKMDQS